MARNGLHKQLTSNVEWDRYEGELQQMQEQVKKVQQQFASTKKLLGAFRPAVVAVVVRRVRRRGRRRRRRRRRVPRARDGAPCAVCRARRSSCLAAATSGRRVCVCVCVCAMRSSHRGGGSRLRGAVCARRADTVQEQRHHHIHFTLHCIALHYITLHYIT